MGNVRYDKNDDESTARHAMHPPPLQASCTLYPTTCLLQVDILDQKVVIKDFTSTPDTRSGPHNAHAMLTTMDLAMDQCFHESHTSIMIPSKRALSLSKNAQKPAQSPLVLLSLSIIPPLFSTVKLAHHSFLFFFNTTFSSSLYTSSIL